MNHLLDVLSLKNEPDVVAIYIGDDHTDEDAFRALKEAGKGGPSKAHTASDAVSVSHSPRGATMHACVPCCPGFGVLVSTKVKATQASFTVRNPAEVKTFLQQLVVWGHTDANGWSRQGPYSSWRHTVTQDMEQ